MNSRTKRKNPFARAAKIAAGSVVLFIIVFGDMIAPYSYESQSREEPNAPAATVRFRDSNGKTQFPFVYRRRLTDRLAYGYDELTDRQFSVSLFVRGSGYRIAGLIPSDIHLFGTENETARITLLGTDTLGRDRFSRLVIALRFSLIVCLAGTLLASVVGIGFGMISGYAGRVTDTVMMGIADSVLALPMLILILAARAGFPLELPPFRAAILLVVIFALTGWAEMARLARGAVRTAREQDYINAARAAGTSESGILFRHIFPNISPVLITQMTIMVPYFLLSEVALSYLGVGLQEPVPSLGNMLANAGDLSQLQRHPILLLSPAFVIFVIVFVVRLFTRPEGSDRELRFL